MRFCTCSTRGCHTENNLELCTRCEQLVCPKHARRAAGAILCPACAPDAPLAEPHQARLFSSVRPRASHGARLMAEQK